MCPKNTGDLTHIPPPKFPAQYLLVSTTVQWDGNVLLTEVNGTESVVKIQDGQAIGQQWQSESRRIEGVLHGGCVSKGCSLGGVGSRRRDL